MSDQFKARIVWMDETPLFSGRIYKFRSNFGTVNAEVVKINDRIDLSGYQKLAGEKLNMNDIGEIEISLSRPVPFDPYSENRETGSFILIDRLTNATSGCGMISHSLRRAQNVHWQNIEISKESRSRLMGQKPALLWLTGLSGAGKSTIANVIEKRLHSIGRHTMLLDGDNIRHGLNKDLGFNEADRIENIRRIGEVAKLMTDAGLIVITSFISPVRSERELARNLLPDGEFLEIFIDTPIEECEARDPKGLYRKARNGEIPNFTGINSPYEVPEKPEITLNTISTDADKLAEIVIKYMSDKGII
jgi:bifunctional enzyme CysN/CysC